MRLSVLQAAAVSWGVRMVGLKSKQETKDSRKHEISLSEKMVGCDFQGEILGPILRLAVDRVSYIERRVKRMTLCCCKMHPYTTWYIINQEVYIGQLCFVLSVGEHIYAGVFVTIT